MDSTEAARHLASLRRRRELVCPVCGKAFAGIGRRRYCSGACRWRAWAERHATTPPAPEDRPLPGTARGKTEELTLGRDPRAQDRAPARQ